MPDPSPPKPTPRAAPGRAEGRGSSARLRVVPSASPSSSRSSAVRRSAAPPTGKIEIVVSRPEAEASQIRQRVGGAVGIPRGLSLRWKIVLAMTAITVATAILIFVAIYSKAMSQLDDEINAKGERLVHLLASIDADYWLTAIHTHESSREVEFQNLVSALGGPPDARSALRGRGFEASYQRVVHPFGHAREAEVGELLTALAGNDKWRSALEADPALRRRYERLARPFSDLSALRPLEALQKESRRELLDAGVVDVSSGEQHAPAVSIAGRTQVTLPAARARQRLTVIEAPRQEGTAWIMSRTFIREPDPDAPKKLRHYVSLSLRGIEDAKGALRVSIFLPIFVSVLLGTGIAIWISTRITEPIKILTEDMRLVSRGNLQHQTVPRSKDEIGLLASTFNRMTQALRAAHQQELEARALEHDLAIASEIQSNLVPKRMIQIPGYDVGAYYRPSKEVGGDYYDFIPIDEDNEGFIVADVSGKGVPGSLVMTMTRAFIRMEAERSRNVSPADTLVRVNRMLAQDIKKGMFVTALYCILNKKTHEIQVASAGHNPLILWRAAADRIDLVNPSGIALGFDKGPVFERTIKEEKIVLARGDRLVAYTDGVVEAMNAAHEEFSDKRFHQLVRQLAARDSNQLMNLVVQALDGHKGDAPQSDDITLVTLRYL